MGLSYPNTGQTTTDRWPTGTEYAAAAQQPTSSFSDPLLAESELTLTPLGLPAMASGQNALAFHFLTGRGPTAVRCFLAPQHDSRARYSALEQFVNTASPPSIVEARWIDEGIRVNGRWWPVVLMPWVEGRPLHDAVEERLGEPQRLVDLADRWCDLVDALQAKRFAHGDLQHGNVLLTDDDQFHLVDLDGVWLPDMGVGPPTEFGHPNYQHRNRGPSDWHVSSDTYSALVIDLSLRALASDAAYADFMSGENLLFTRRDLAQPGDTDVWRALHQHPDDVLRELTSLLTTVSRSEHPPAMPLDELMRHRSAPDTIPQPAQDDAAANQPKPLPTPAAGPGADAWWQTGGAGAAPGASATAPPAPGRAPNTPPPPAPAERQRAVTPPTAPGRGAQRGGPATTSPAAAAHRRRPPMVTAALIGSIAGVLGIVVGGALAEAFPDHMHAGPIVASIAGLLVGLVNSWSSISLRAYDQASSRFAVGAGLGIVISLVGVGLVELLQSAAIESGTETNALVVSLSWSIVAFLIGLATGALRSPTAAALGAIAGGWGGAFGGAIHGATTARFHGRRMVIEPYDGLTFLILVAVAIIVAAAVGAGVRFARRGSLTVIEGTGSGTIVEIHSASASIGSSGSDDLVVVNDANVVSGHATIRLHETGATVVPRASMLIDGQPATQPVELRSGAVLTVGGCFVRFELTGADA